MYNLMNLTSKTSSKAEKTSLHKVIRKISFLLPQFHLYLHGLCLRAQEKNNNNLGGATAGYSRNGAPLCVIQSARAAVVWFYFGSRNPFLVSSSSHQLVGSRDQQQIALLRIQKAVERSNKFADGFNGAIVVVV